MAEIRLATMADAQAMAEIYGKYVSSSAISFELEPPSEEDFRMRVSSILPEYPWLVYAKDQEILGYAYASRHSERPAYKWSVNTAVYIREDCHRQGIGRALYTSLLACLGLQGFYAAHAGVTLPNLKSVGLHESFGFKPVGVYRKVGYKFGAWHDVGWWQLSLRDRSGTPQKPRSVAEIQKDPLWDEAMKAGQSLRRL